MSIHLNGKASNPKDPMLKSAPERVAHLVKEFGKTADLFSIEDVINASAAMMVNALRQHYQTKQEVELRYDEIAGRMKSILLNHYDSISGRKKGVFPYDQNLSPGLVDARSKVITH